MLNVRLLRTEAGELVGYLMTGHAEYDEIGSDIVCASVSSVAYYVANTITEIMDLEPLLLNVNDDMGENSFTLRVKEADSEKCRDMLKGLELHIKALAEDYPDYINLDYLEVQENA